MSDDLLRYYERELSFIKNESQDFANRYPKIAGRLQLGADELEDPLVERLISSFAFLNARTQQKLDDDFPELSDAILGTLYPHYQQPIPSMTVVQFDRGGKIKEKTTIARGAQLQTATIAGVACEFKTCYDTTLYPLNVAEAQLKFRPFVAPAANTVAGDALLHLRLDVSGEGMTVQDLLLQDLRFYIKGQSNLSQKLYELLFQKTNKVVIAASENDPNPIQLSGNCIRPVGFSTSEGMLNYPDNSFLGYRLLTEFFVFPEKFLFFDLANLANAVADNSGSELHLYFYLDDADAELEHQITRDNFELGCTPAINFFKHSTESIRLNHQKVDYPVVADSQHANSYEILSIDSVEGIAQDGTQSEYFAFFSQNYHQSKKAGGRYWNATRKTVIEGEHNNEVATELAISFIDANLNNDTPVDVVLSISAQCCNRNVPAKIPFSGSITLQGASNDIPTVPINCISAPTPTLRAPLKSGAYWRLISHLNLNHLSLSSDSMSRQALLEILRLYDFRDSASTRTMIESIDQVITRTINAPITIDGRSVLCRGTEVEIVFDPMKIGGQSVFLFANILEVFLGLYCSINSFVRLIAKEKGREQVLKKWPPRAGERQLL